MTDTKENLFAELVQDEEILRSLIELGYEAPSPIQVEAIPVIAAGKDVLGQAQTGTGKTAAFALPSFNLIDINEKSPQVLVMVPTRELAIQVAEAYQQYGKYKSGFHVTPIYGGQSYDQQIRKLKRGVQVVVGTPGRLTDMMKKGYLKLDKIKILILDEADEMLKMDFVAEVEWVLEQTPEEKQIALLSATISSTIRKISQKYLKSPVEIRIEVKQKITDKIEQKLLLVDSRQKLEALTRILESIDFEAMIIFVRTKRESLELTDKLEARGYKAAPLNGDLSQNHREQTLRSFKNGKVDILIATDVAARGIDIDRVDHILNYDIPQDTESYVHRIGRTGRAGRKGTAILLVEPRERQLLKAIERMIEQKIDLMKIPTSDFIQKKRILAFKNKITENIEEEDLSFFKDILNEYTEQTGHPLEEITAALMRMAQGNQSLVFSAPDLKEVSFSDNKRNDKYDRGGRKGRREGSGGRDEGRRREPKTPSADMVKYKIQLGRKHGIKPGHIVGAIANEGKIDSRMIGPIEIMGDFSVIHISNKAKSEDVKKLSNVKIMGKSTQFASADAKSSRRRD